MSSDKVMSNAASRGSLPPPARVAPAETPNTSGMMALQVGVVVIVALYLAREVLIPITLAILLSFLLVPVVGLLRRLRLPRVPAILLSVVLALGLALGIGGVIGTQVASLAEDVPRYASTVQKKIELVQNFAVSRLSSVLRGVSRPAQPVQPAQQPAPPPALANNRQAAPAAAAPENRAPLPVEVHQPDPSPLEMAERVLAPVLGPLGTTGIVFVFAIFILLQQEDLRDRLIRLFGSGDLHRTTAALDDAGARLSRYFLAQFALNASFGCVIALGLFFIGVPSPILWGVLAALLRFVPYVGSVLAAAFPLALAAAVDPGWTTLAWTGALFVVVEAVAGQVVEPMLYGHSTGLSPFSVIVAATFWTWLWGPIGLILSTPMTLCLVVMGRHVKRLEFLDVMLGDRPALTPVESFYQRMLAGDPDEAQDQAELLLKERSLSSYYDEVALKGLRLAVNDLQRGVLKPAQLEQIRNAVTELVEDLDDNPDRDPDPDEIGRLPLTSTLAEQELPRASAPSGGPVEPSTLVHPWSGEGAVLCVSGRGPLDEAASAILAQLLRKHGLGARVLAHDDVSRANIAMLDVSSAAMICVSYLELGGNPSHLRYLVHRLRARMPGRKLLVGLWPSDTVGGTDERLRAAVGADLYAGSLRDAVEACLVEAGAHSALPAAEPVEATG
jgi:predicted PurR-regulated permease PerM